MGPFAEQKRSDQFVKLNHRCLIRVGLAACLIATGFSYSSNGFAAEGLLGSDAAALSDSGPRRLSTNANEVIRLAETGVEEEVILAYIENSQSPFALSAEDIIYLKDLGIAAPVIAAMLASGHDTPGPASAGGHSDRDD